MEDKLILNGHEFSSRFILGSGKYSLDLITAAVENAGAQIITLALRRARGGDVANILDYIPKAVTLLPNTSGARNADEAVRIARLARETGCGDFVKIEAIRDTKYLLPDNYETLKATEILAKEGFVVMSSGSNLIREQLIQEVEKNLNNAILAAERASIPDEELIKLLRLLLEVNHE